VITLTSPDLVADRIDLARPDDDGAPAACSSPVATARAPSAILAGLPLPRLRFDPALIRPGAVDGGWWPYSRNALTELPGLIALLKDQAGVRAQRVSVHREEWDEIPARLAVGGRVVRVDWFMTIPRHTISVTVAGREPIALLVVPPGTPAEAAQAAMNLAATSPAAAQAGDILTAGEARCRL
jgi:hypothetical protein